MIQSHFGQNQVEENSDEKSLTLLSGSLPSEDAHESVGKLISSAQNYFTDRLFSQQIRFGDNDIWSEEMLSSIDSASPSVISLIDQASARGQRVRIVANIAVVIEGSKLPD